MVQYVAVFRSSAEKMQIQLKNAYLVSGLILVMWFLAGPNLLSYSSGETYHHYFLTQQNLRKGVFLVASPTLLDPNFREAVVLICIHEDGGTLGIIVNRPTKLPLSEVFPSISGLTKLSHTLFEGGPVQQDVLLMLFRSGTRSDNTKVVMDGVHWGGDRDKLASMVANPDPNEQFRVFAGYAGWTHSQLEAEIMNGFWNIVPADANNIFESDPSSLWQQLLEHSHDRRYLISYHTGQAF